MKQNKHIDIAKKRREETEMLNLMITIYCNGKHKTKGSNLCSSCTDLMRYADERVKKCPFMETKTFCSACRVHCYKSEKRDEIRNVMKYSGPRMLYIHPVAAIKHCISTIKNKRKEKKNV